PCPHHKVYLNGYYIGDLKGDDGFSTTTFTVGMIDTMKFLAEDENADYKANVIRIQWDADYASSGRDYFCYANVDWVAITYEAQEPVVFVPGVGPQFTPYKTALHAEGQMYADGLDQRCADTYQNNAASLDTYIDEMRSHWGVDRVNLIGY